MFPVDFSRIQRLLALKLNLHPNKLLKPPKKVATIALQTRPNINTSLIQIPIQHLISLNLILKQFLIIILQLEHLLLADLQLLPDGYFLFLGQALTI